MAGLVQSKLEFGHTQGDTTVLIRSSALQVRNFGTQTEESLLSKNTKFGKTIGIQTGWGYPGVMMMNTGIQTEVHFDCQNKGSALAVFISKTSDFLDRRDEMKRFDDSYDIDHCGDDIDDYEINDEYDIEDDNNESDEIEDSIDSDYIDDGSINESMFVKNPAVVPEKTGNVQKDRSQRKKIPGLKQEEIIGETSELNKVNMYLSSLGVWHQIVHIGREEEVVSMATENQRSFGSDDHLTVSKVQKVEQMPDSQHMNTSALEEVETGRSGFDEYADLENNETCEVKSGVTCSVSEETMETGLEMSVVEINEHDYSAQGQGPYVSDYAEKSLIGSDGRILEGRSYHSNSEITAEKNKEILENMKKMSAVVKLEKLDIDEHDLSRVENQTPGHQTRSKSGAIVTVSNRGKSKGDYKIKTIFVEKSTGLVPVKEVSKASWKTPAEKERSSSESRNSSKRPKDSKDKDLENSVELENEFEIPDDNKAGLRKVNLKCPVCSKFVGSKQKLDHHLKKCKKKHIYQCPLCVLTFRHCKDYYKHKAFHEEYKDNNCKYCGRPFVGSQFLNQHVLVSHNPNKYICHWCNRRVFSLQALKNHLQTHSVEEEKNAELLIEMYENNDNQDHTEKTSYKTRLSTGVISQTRYDKFINFSTNTDQSVKISNETIKGNDNSGPGQVEENSDDLNEVSNSQEKNKYISTVSKKIREQMSEKTEDDLNLKEKKLKVKWRKKKKSRQGKRVQESTTEQDHCYTDPLMGGSVAAREKVIDTVLEAPFEKILDEEGNEYIVVIMDNSYVYVQNPLVQDIDQNLVNIVPNGNVADSLESKNITDESLIGSQIVTDTASSSSVAEFPFPWTRKSRKSNYKKKLFPKKKGPKNRTPEYSVKLTDLGPQNNPAQHGHISEQEQAAQTVVSILENGQTSSTGTNLNLVENIEGQPELGDILNMDDIGMMSEVVIPHSSGTISQSTEVSPQTIEINPQNTKVVPQDTEISPPTTVLKHKKYEIDESLKNLPPAKNPLECRYCGKVFNYKASRESHERRHTTPKELLYQYACTKCGKRFETLTNTNNHYRNLHNREFMRQSQCHICGKSLANPSSLNSHLRMHSGYRPVECKICGRCFGQKSTLTKHMRSHTGERVVPKFPCDICGKKFATSYNRKLHYMTHTGERPFPCNFCPREFRTRSFLNSHVQSSHSFFTEDKSTPGDNA